MDKGGLDHMGNMEAVSLGGRHASSVTSSVPFRLVAFISDYKIEYCIREY